jgi:hypothetical protein
MSEVKKEERRISSDEKKWKLTGKLDKIGWGGGVASMLTFSGGAKVHTTQDASPLLSASLTQFSSRSSSILQACIFFC